MEFNLDALFLPCCLDFDAKQAHLQGLELTLRRSNNLVVSRIWP
jgi:hypothetical protein